MFTKRRKKSTSTYDTIIGQHTEIVGDLKFAGGLHIDGTVKGNVTAGSDDSAKLQISEKGTIEGEVRVPFIDVNGVIVGDVHGSEHIKLLSKTRITGNVYYNLIEMAIGAEVNGQLVHTPAEEESRLALGHADPLENSD